MNITINGTKHAVEANNLSDLLIELDYADQVVATAKNKAFVRAVDRAATHISEGDEIEILTPRQGG